MTGGCGFEPRPSHTKDFKPGARTDQPGVNIMLQGEISCHVSGA